MDFCRGSPWFLGVWVWDKWERGAGVQAGGQDQGDQHHANQPQQRQEHLR